MQRWKDPQLLSKQSDISLICFYGKVLSVNPNVAKVGGIQNQGAKGAAVALYCNPLATPDMDFSGYPVRVTT